MKDKVTCFEDLRIWQLAQELAVKTYLLADNNEFIKKDFSLKDQLKSSAISISDNIAEGFGYNNNPDYYKFLRIAKGSCSELVNKLLFLEKINYVTGEEIISMITDVKSLGAQIGSLLIKVKTKIMQSKKKPL
jgi:four helix bundle protein